MFTGTKRELGAHLPSVLADLAVRHMCARKRTWKHISRAGEFESCLEAGQESHFDTCAAGACVGGHLLLARAMRRLCGLRSFCIFSACRGGHTDVVNVALSELTTEWNSAIAGACRGANADLARRIARAASGGHMVLAFDAEECSAFEVATASRITNWNIALHAACRRGHAELVRLCVRNGANWWSYGLAGACRGGHTDLVRMLIDKGATDWNTGLREACKGRHSLVAALMIEKGATFHDFKPNFTCVCGRMAAK
jgi:hypothetical protein